MRLRNKRNSIDNTTLSHDFSNNNNCLIPDPFFAIINLFYVFKSICIASQTTCCMKLYRILFLISSDWLHAMENKPSMHGVMKI